MTCGDLDIVCVANQIYSGILLIVSWLTWATTGVLDGLSNIVVFIATLTTLGTSSISFITGFLETIYATNPNASAYFTLATSPILIVVSIRIWNFICDLSLFGWKLPKIEL